MSDMDGSFVFEDEMLKGGTTVYRAAASLSGELIIPEGITDIAAGAFSGCGSLTSVHLPASAANIGEEGFSYCAAIKSIDFAEGLWTIGDSAFMLDQALETAMIPTTVESIGSNAFAYCTKLNKVILPEGVKTIGEDAFIATALDQISIPKSVESIGTNAFGYVVVSGQRQKSDSFKMSVFSGSAGEKFAKKEKLSYTSTDINIKKVAFIAAMIGIAVLAVAFAAALMKKGRKTATAGARRALKKEKAEAAEKSYKKIIGSADEKTESAGEEDGEVDEDTEEDE